MGPGPCASPSRAFGGTTNQCLGETSAKTFPAIRWTVLFVTEQTAWNCLMWWEDFHCLEEAGESILWNLRMRQKTLWRTCEGVENVKVSFVCVFKLWIVWTFCNGLQDECKWSQNENYWCARRESWNSGVTKTELKSCRIRLVLEFCV